MLGVFCKQAAAKHGVMSVGERANVRMRGEILLQPGLFRRALGASAQSAGFATGVQDNKVPRAEVEAVIAFLRLAGAATPVAKIASGGGAVVFVISRCWAGTRFEATPGWAIAFQELFVGAVLIGEVTGGENRAGNCVDQFRRSLGAREVRAADDISRPDQSECIRLLITGGFRPSFGTCRSFT